MGKNIRFLFENPANPSNVWACLRTIDSFGIQNVDVVLDSSMYSGKLALIQKTGMRTAMGSAKWLTIETYLSTQEAVRKLKSQGFVICVSDLNPDSTDVRDIPWEKLKSVKNHKAQEEEQTKICIVLGNENNGVSQEMKAEADISFILPMKGFAESFNLSVATAIILAHISDYKKEKLLVANLDNHEKNYLQLKWMLDSLSQKKVGTLLLKRNGIDISSFIDQL